MASSIINSKTYVLGISQESLYSDIYKIFYAILSKNVTVTGKDRVWYSAFPDIDIDSKEDYPFFIINSPSITDESFTMTKEILPTSLEIEVYTTSANTRDEYSSNILYQIKANKHYLRKLGIRKLKLQTDDSDMIMRDKIKLHTKRLVFSFEYVLNKVSLSW